MNPSPIRVIAPRPLTPEGALRTKPIPMKNRNPEPNTYSYEYQTITPPIIRVRVRVCVSAKDEAGRLSPHQATSA